MVRYIFLSVSAHLADSTELNKRVVLGEERISVSR